MLANMYLWNSQWIRQKNCEQKANIFTSVIPRPLFTNMLQMHCECLPMPYELLTIVANGANGLKNKCCDWLANVMNACECLQMGLKTLQTYLWMIRMSYQRCHCLAIFLRIMRIFDDEAVIGINTEWIWRWAHCFLEFNSGKTFARDGKRRTLQTACKCLTNVASASECLTNVTNGLRMLTNIDGEWQYSQHSLKFRRRFLNWSIFVSKWRMTCERYEFVTNAYKYSASVANFERMSNLFIRKHIRKHIRLCVRAALVKKITSLP